MGDTLHGKVTIQGTRPLLWHHFDPASFPDGKRKARDGVAGNDPSEWKRTVTVTEDGQLYLKPSCVFACFRDGGKYTSKGRGSLQPHVAATLRVLTARVLIDRWLPPNIEKLINTEEELVYLDVRGVINPSNKARHIRYRVAVSPGWQADFDISWDQTLVTENQMRQIVYDAGRYCGIGSGRAVGFGRFTVVSFNIWEEEKNAQETAAKGDLARNKASRVATRRRAMRALPHPVNAQGMPH